jgi:hypothetical protein
MIKTLGQKGAWKYDPIMFTVLYLFGLGLGLGLLVRIGFPSYARQKRNFADAAWATIKRRWRAGR